MSDDAKTTPAGMHEAIRTLLFAAHAAQQLVVEIAQGKPGNLLKRQFDESVKALLRAAHRVSGISPDALQVFADRMPAEWQDRVESSWHRLAQKQCLEKSTDLCRVIYRNATAEIDESSAWPLPGDVNFPEVLRAYADQAGKHAEVVARQWTASPLFPLVDVKRVYDAIRVEFERASTQDLPPYLNITLDVLNQRITRNGKSFDATPLQMKVCGALAAAREVGLEVEKLADKVWNGPPPDSWRNSLDNATSQLGGEEKLLALRLTIAKDRRGVWRLPYPLPVWPA